MIYLVGDVNEAMTLGVLMRLDKNPKRANFMLSSMGGSLGDGLAIYDRINRLPNAIITATGICASAATVILQAASIRRATPRTQFMVHLVKFDDLDDNKAFKTHYDNATYKIFTKSVPPRDYMDALKLKIFDAKTALALHFIDEIWDGAGEKSGLS